MKLDSTKIILILVAMLQSAIIYIGTDIITRLSSVENRIDRGIKAGAFDMVADYLADQDSLSFNDYHLLEYILTGKPDE